MRIPSFFIFGSNGLNALKKKFVLLFFCKFYLPVVSYVSIAESPAHPPPQKSSPIAVMVFQMIFVKFFSQYFFFVVYLLLHVTLFPPSISVLMFKFLLSFFPFPGTYLLFIISTLYHSYHFKQRTVYSRWLR